MNYKITKLLEKRDSLIKAMERKSNTIKAKYPTFQPSAMLTLLNEKLKWYTKRLNNIEHRIHIEYLTK